MKYLKYIKFKFFLGLIRNIFLKIRYGSQIKLNIFRVFIDKDVNIQILNNGSITFDASRDRIFISRGCDIISSGGVIHFGDGFFMNKNVTIVSHQSIHFGNDVMLGPNVCIFDSDHNFISTHQAFRYQGYKKKQIFLGDNVWVGANAILLGGAEIQSNVVIGANSMVKHSLEKNAVYVGSPAKKVKNI
ncbi:acyltransferase [Methylophilus glucosoxydans]|uniref:Acyltransferase n=1 Tax=Methylophilus glucosoxydans TaxID=752553 RepID=A0ABW3GM85_9PROT